MRRVMSGFLICFSLLLVLLLGLALPGCGKSTGTQSASPAAQEPLEKGDPDWWKKQPDLKKEEQAIQTVMTDFGKALTAKDVKQVAVYFSPDVRDKYSQALGSAPDLMPKMAADLQKATLNFLSLDTDFSLSRMAEYAITKDGKTFYIKFIKIDGKWMLESF